MLNFVLELWVLCQNSKFSAKWSCFRKWKTPEGRPTRVATSLAWWRAPAMRFDWCCRVKCCTAALFATDSLVAMPVRYDLCTILRVLFALDHFSTQYIADLQLTWVLIESFYVKSAYLEQLSLLPALTYNYLPHLHTKLYIAKVAPNWITFKPVATTQLIIGLIILFAGHTLAFSRAVATLQNNRRFPPVAVAVSSIWWWPLKTP